MSNVRVEKIFDMNRYEHRHKNSPSQLHKKDTTSTTNILLRWELAIY